MKKIHLALIILFIASSLLFIFNIYHVKPIYINKLPYIISSPGYYVINTTTATTLNETAIIINSDNVILDGKGCILKGRGNYCGIKIDEKKVYLAIGENETNLIENIGFIALLIFE